MSASVYDCLSSAYLRLIFGLWYRVRKVEDGEDLFSSQHADAVFCGFCGFSSFQNRKNRGNCTLSIAIYCYTIIHANNSFSLDYANLFHILAPHAIHPENIRCSSSRNALMGFTFHRFRANIPKNHSYICIYAKKVVSLRPKWGIGSNSTLSALKL